MCGIAGILQPGADVSRLAEPLKRMTDALTHRGPDAEGHWFSEGAALGHRRLSIIDLSGGAQPMVHEESGLAVAFNGEIYNFPELRSELEGIGHRFRTHSDTEVLLLGYLAWGESFVERLNGMFAFALWDPRRKRLMAARDRLGKKPFYFARLGDRLLFASELKSLLAAGGLDRRVEPSALRAYLSLGYLPSDTCILSGVQKLKPGHALHYADGQLETRRYWGLRFAPEPREKSEEEWVDGLEGILKAAVKRRLISDVPLGAFLSGGLDSSLVVALMAQVAGEKVKTFTIRFDESEYSEADAARELAGILGTEHHEFTVAPANLDLLPELVYHLDEPFADSSALPTYQVSKAARAQVTVILSGDGGDELFAGYRSYLKRDEFRRLAALPKSLRRGLLGPLARALPPGVPGRNTLMAAALLRPEFGDRVFEEFPPILSWLLREDSEGSAARGLSGTALDRALAALPGIPPGPSLSRWQAVDAQLYLPDDILVKVDRMSMAVSLETRAPLLDYTVAEYAARIPASLQMKDGRGKYLLRRVAARHLPEAVLARKKQGFSIPRAEWFRGAWKGRASDLLESREFRERGYFRSERVSKMLSDHAAGKADYGYWIWALMALEEWHRAYLDGATRRV